ncbi:maleylpyruvate isomerase N-terminal domain-containing protein [Nocardiopsis rhodophaea]
MAEWRRADVMAALCAEAPRVAGVLLGLAEEEAVRPTRCAPWDVAALAVHMVGALHQVALMLDDVAPERALVEAAGYYTPDGQMSAQTDEERVASAVEAAARRSDAGEMGRVCEGVWRELEPRLAKEPSDRVVLTRHGDAMLLTDFLVTRVVELALHGLDLADALGRDAGMSPEALDVVARLLFGNGDPGLPAMAAVRAATGRVLPGGAGPEALAGSGVRVLALGRRDGAGGGDAAGRRSAGSG